jgi:hypothetical protein
LSLFSLIREGFIDEHYRDIFPNGVNQMTGFADQSISRSVQKDIPFTLRAC